MTQSTGLWRPLFWALLIFIVAVAVMGIVAVGGSLVWENLKPQLVAQYIDSLSEQEKLDLNSRLLADTGAYWDATAEPLVGVLGRRGYEITTKDVPIRLNKAGFRSDREFQPPSDNHYRIVCLGDSFVFGTGAPVADRFCDQMETFYGSENITVDGRTIETYALGLGGWTAVQEASYLSARITAYAPDVIIVLSTANDFTSAFGVQAGGVLSRAFSPEYRDQGSGVFWHKAAGQFGWTGRSALSRDLGPASRHTWNKSMTALARLARLQHQRGGHILFSMLEREVSEQTHLYQQYLLNLDVSAPFLTTNYFPDDGNRLPDGHPNRAGHAILAAHYLHALSRLNWIPVTSEQLPDLHEGLSLNLRATPDADVQTKKRQAYRDRHLRDALAFCCLEPVEAAALLGGIFPERRAEDEEPPWASVRSGFLLRDSGDGTTLELSLEVPARVELFPFELAVYVDGQRAEILRLDSVDQAGQHRIRVPATDREGDGVVEVVLETDAYFADIIDPRMKSFRLVSARISAE